MLKESQGYHYEMAPDGVGLVKNYRSQFLAIIRVGSYQGFVRQLRERTVGDEGRR